MMFLSKVVKTATCCGTAAVIFFPTKLQAKELVACHECHMKRLPKARELPLYEKDDLSAEYDEGSSLPLVSEISSVRKQISKYTTYFNLFQDRAVHIYETGVAHSKSTLDYLKDEENKVQRAMFIASGGLIGLLYARKRGMFKKVVYTTLGTGFTFSVFYPSVSKEYIQAGWKTSTSQINDALVNYGGFDTDKMAKEANEKLEYVKSAMKFEGLMAKFNEMFHRNKEAASKEDEAGKSPASKEA